MVFFPSYRTCKQYANRLNRPKNPRAEALFDSAEEEIFFCTRDAMDTHGPKNAHDTHAVSLCDAPETRLGVC